MYIGRNRNLTSYEHLNYPHTKLYEIVDIDFVQIIPLHENQTRLHDAYCFRWPRYSGVASGAAVLVFPLTTSIRFMRTAVDSRSD